MLPTVITVLRSGRELRRPAADLVPGDVVAIGEGDQMPADGQLLSATRLRVDQSALTGESHPVFKLPEPGNNRASVPVRERQELVFAGTAAVAGAGRFVVRATATRTEIGLIAQLTQTVAEAPSPLQREMARVTRRVSFLAAARRGGIRLPRRGDGRSPRGGGLPLRPRCHRRQCPRGLAADAHARPGRSIPFTSG